ncbi:MAG: class I SAM-dependent rRNA methyltransferase [Gemmatimonadota bacterium]
MTPRGAHRALSRHPWIYRSDVVDVPIDLPNGAIVRVIDNRNRVLGRASWSARSQIALRFVRWEDEEVDEAFWAARLEAAIARRERSGMIGPARRLVFGEADGWPGLVVDQYGDCLVVQTLTPVAELMAESWTRLLVERLEPRAIVARNDLKVRRLEGLEPEVVVWHGEPPEPFPVTIGERSFMIDVMGGQKTGAYLDQQANYPAAARYAAGAEGALDAFAGEGGFSLHLAPVVGRVEAVEISKAAAGRGRENAAANSIGNVEWTVANAFDRLHGLAGEEARFGAIVLDPPAFAKNRKSVAAARRGYKEINLRALKCLEPGGVLITCSCSYHVDREAFRAIVAEAAADAHRTVEVLEVRTQAPDHPILLSVPETEYLKCLMLRAH